MFKSKIISCLDKAMPASSFDSYKSIDKLTVLRGEKASFQILIFGELMSPASYSRTISLSFSGGLSEFIQLREVQPVPAINCAKGNPDADFLTTVPSLIPDVLAPLGYENKVFSVPGCLRTVWVDINVPAEGPLPEELTLTVKLSHVPRDPKEASKEEEHTVSLEVIDATLPESALTFSMWFHHDCLADYYGVPMWSDKHFEIIERFVKCATDNGINTLLTPVLTPPLDNMYDNRYFQLVDITCRGDEYEFGFEKLGKWVDICNKYPVRYFEIGHLFTQGGAKYATKVMGMKDGKLCRLFSVDTPCDAPEYTKFLRALLKAFISYMKERGEDKRMLFHISDEPNDADLETYLKAKESVADLLDGYTLMDALSHYEFYERGVVKKPIVILHHLAEFIEHDVEGLWTYNCTAPDSGYSNRFLAMSLSRNRSISLLLYKFNIEGFLHWGFNFYNNCGSGAHINPFLDTSSGGGFPSGDAFSVYPGAGGEPLESMRLVTFKQGLDDLAAFRLCESLYSREEVISALESFLGEEIKTTTYINDSERMTALRNMINEMIKAKL